MSEKRYLETYLQDHYAAATAGVSLARRIASQNTANPVGQKVSELAEEIEDEATVLRNILRALDISPSLVKGASARVAEKLGRLKLNNEVVRYSPLSRVLELEGLQSGVRAKQCLWRALLLACDHHPELEPFPLTELRDRADHQLELLQALHHDAVIVLIRHDRTLPHDADRPSP